VFLTINNTDTDTTCEETQNTEQPYIACFGIY